jgi:hypothetical protein
MKACEQTKDLSVLDHGIMVHEYFLDLLSYLNDGPVKYTWRMPVWIDDNKEFLLKNLLPLEVLKQYHIFHDIGKPYCLTIDDEGRRHFYNHAEVSYQVWKSTGGCEEIGLLIRSDMDIHLLKSEDVESFSSRSEAITLLLTGLSEVHANASLFGGIENTSFKIKLKHIEKRGKQIIKIKQTV